MPILSYALESHQICEPDKRHNSSAASLTKAHALGEKAVSRALF
jgi:hypothetical protein